MSNAQTSRQHPSTRNQLGIARRHRSILVAGDLIYSGVHLILAGPADTWSEAINGLVADSADYPIVGELRPRQTG